MKMKPTEGVSRRFRTRNHLPGSALVPRVKRIPFRASPMGHLLRVCLLNHRQSYRVNV